MERYEDEPCTLGTLLRVLNAPKKIGKNNGNGWEFHDEPHRVSINWVHYRLERVDYKNDTLTLHLFDENENPVRKDYNIMNVGWCHNTYGSYEIIHQPPYHDTEKLTIF